MHKTLIAAGSALALSVSLLAVPAPAQAATAGGCGYPYVCLYVGGQMSHPSGRFRDITSGWQWLGRSFGAKSFRNTRHDDVAYIKTTSGATICVGPRTSGGLFPDAGGATAIRISTRSHC